VECRENSLPDGPEPITTISKIVPASYDLHFSLYFELLLCCNISFFLPRLLSFYVNDILRYFPEEIFLRQFPTSFDKFLCIFSYEVPQLRFWIIYCINDSLGNLYWVYTSLYLLCIKSCLCHSIVGIIFRGTCCFFASKVCLDTTRLNNSNLDPKWL
jgi:hypothetical protein